MYDPLLEQLRAVAVAGKVAYEARGVMAAREGRWNEALEQFDKMLEVGKGELDKSGGAELTFPGRS